MSATSSSSASRSVAWISIQVFSTAAPVVAVVDGGTDRVDEPVVRRPVGVAEPVDAGFRMREDSSLRVCSPAASRSASASLMTVLT